MWAKYNQEFYFQNEDEWEIVNGIIEKSQDWQWFVDRVESYFFMNDVKNYKTYRDLDLSYRRIIEKFYDVLAVCDNPLQYTYPLTSDFITLALFNLEKINKQECIKSLKTNSGKIMLLYVWMTKHLLTSAGITNSVMAGAGFDELYFSKAINVRTFRYDKDDYLDYARRIELPGFEAVKQNILLGVEKVPCENFIHDKICIMFASVNSSFRAVMTKYIFLDYVKSIGLEDKFYVDCRELEEKNTDSPIFPEVIDLFEKKNIAYEPYIAQMANPQEYYDYDYLIGLTIEDEVFTHTIMGGDEGRKMSMLMDYCDNPRDVAAPKKTIDFEACYEDILEGCKNLVDYFLNKDTEKTKRIRGIL